MRRLVREGQSPFCDSCLDVWLTVLHQCCTSTAFAPRDETDHAAYRMISRGCSWKDTLLSSCVGYCSATASCGIPCSCRHEHLLCLPAGFTPHDTAGGRQLVMLRCALYAGINTFTAALAGVLPCTTFAQNNGVIALSRCASRYAGFSCGIWLFLFGVLAKFGAFWTSVP